MKKAIILLIVLFILVGCEDNSGLGTANYFSMLCMGQSNALAVGSGGGDLATDSRVTVWNTTAAAWIVADPSATTAATMIHPSYTQNNNIIWFHLAKQIAEDYNVNVRIIIQAQGAAYIGSWVGKGVSSTLYAAMKTQLTNSNVGEIDACFWHQGESNFATENLTTYPDSLNTLLSQLHAETEIDSTMPFIAGEMLDRTNALSHTLNYFWENAQDSIRSPYFAVAYLRDLPHDPICDCHFSGTAMVTAGRERYYGTWKAMPKANLSKEFGDIIG